MDGIGKEDKTWYKVSVYRAHKRPGVLHDAVANIFADDVFTVLARYKHMPGVKRIPKEGDAIQTLPPCLWKNP